VTDVEVIFLWQKTCDNCTDLKHHGVLRRIRRVFGPLPDVWWRPKQLAPQAPKETVNGDTTHRHRLTMENGRVIGKPVFGANLNELRDTVDELYTPLIVFMEGNESEEVDVVEAVGADPDIDYTEFDTEDNAVDAITETPNQAARILVNRTFRFYVQQVVRIPTAETRKLRREKHPNPNYAHHLKPPHNWNDETGDVQFDTQGWIEAFTRAREAEY